MPRGSAAFALAFLATAALWWLYFNYVARIAQRRLELAPDRTNMARDAYTYLHVVMIAGVIVSAVGDELVIAHPTEELAGPEVAAVVAGPAIYLLAHALFRLRMAGSVEPEAPRRRARVRGGRRARRAGAGAGRRCAAGRGPVRGDRLRGGGGPPADSARRAGAARSPRDRRRRAGRRLARRPAQVHGHGRAGEGAGRRAQQERDDVGDLVGLDQALDRVRREDDLLERRAPRPCRAPWPGRRSAPRRAACARSRGRRRWRVMPSSAPSSASVFTSPSTPCLADT